MMNLARTKIILQAIGLLVFLLIGCAQSQAAERPRDFFYQKEPLGSGSRQGCSELFGAILKGKKAAGGGIVKNLRYINIHFLLEDYDNSLSSDPRKNKHLKTDDLLAEIAASKREIYCRVELALYMSEKESFQSPVYDQLVSSALDILQKTYASAEQSVSLKNYERAKFAFDLIVPYKDAYQKYLDADQQLQAATEVSTEQSSKGDNPAKSPVSGATGPVALAVLAKPVAELMEAGPDTLGPIALAARPGVVAAAVAAPGQNLTAENPPD